MLRRRKEQRKRLRIILSKIDEDDDDDEVDDELTGNILPSRKYTCLTWSLVLKNRISLQLIFTEDESRPEAK